MKRPLLFGAVLLVAAGVVVAPAFAQETKVELSAGIEYPLLGQGFEIDQGLGWRFSAGWRITPKFTLSAQYAQVASTSDIPNEPIGDVTWTTYGLNGTLVLNGEQDFQLLGFVGAGLGDLSFDNPLGDPPAGQSNDSGIYWYEAGVGAQFNLSKRWALRLLAAARQTGVSDPTPILPNSSFCFVPKAEVGFRF